MAETNPDLPSEPIPDKPEPSTPPAARSDWLRTVARATETVAPLVARQAPRPEDIPTDRRGRWATILAIVGILTAVTQFLLQFFDLVTRPLAPLSQALPYIAAALFAAAGIYAVFSAVRARSRRQRLASLGLAATILVIGVAWGGWLLMETLRPPSGYRILVGEFDGAASGQRIDFARRIAENLRTQLAGSGVPIEIRRTTDIFQDAQSAIDQGRRQKAGLVIWGWYDDQGVSPHVEVLEMPGTAQPATLLPIVFARASAAGPAAGGPPLDATLAKVGRVTRAPASLPDLALFAQHGPDQIAFVTGAVLGLGMLASGQEDQARTLFDQALAAVEGDPAAAQGREIVYYQRALLNYAGGRLPEARQDLETALQLRPDFHEAHTLLALVLTGVCDPALDLTRALAEAEEAAALQPGDAAAQRFVAELALQVGDITTASRAAAEAQRLAPDSPEVHGILAAVYDAQDQTADATLARDRSLALWQQTIAAPEGATTDNLLALGDAYLAVDDYAGARTAYMRAGEISPGDPRVERGLMNVLYWEGNQDAALAAATAAAMRYPEDGYWPMMAGTIAGELGRQDDALAAWQRSAQLAGCDPAPYLLLGNAYFLRGDMASASTSYRQALALAPTSQPALYAAGAAALATGDNQAARDAFAALAEQTPEALDVQYWLGTAFSGLGEEAKAKTAFERVVRLGENAGPGAFLAYAYGELGRLDDAIATYVKLLAEQETADLHTYLAMTYIEKGVADLAADELNRALALQPEHKMALLTLGNLQFDQGEMAAASTTYERYLQLENTPVTQLMAAITRQQLGDLDGAYRHFQEADRLQPQDPRITYQAGMVATWLGRLDEASAYLDTAQRLQPNDGSIGLMHATIAQKRCRLADAIVEVERAVALAPDNLLFKGVLAGNYLADNQGEKIDPILDMLQAAPAGDSVAHWMAGTLLAQRGQNAEAIEEFSLALAAPEITPGIAAAAQTTLGQLYWRENNATRAVQAFEAALAADPDYIEAQAGLGVLALEAGASAAAIGHFDAALDGLAAYGRKYSFDGATLFKPLLDLYLALGHRQAGDRIAAGDSLRRAGDEVTTILQRTPEWPNARLIQGMLATLTGDTQAAQAAYTHAVTCDATLERARDEFVAMVEGETGD